MNDYQAACAACGHVLTHHEPQMQSVLDYTCKWRGCGCPWYIPGPRPEETITLFLSQYERDNMLHALIAATANSPRSPLYALNTGDWVMQVLNKLGYRGGDTDWGQPNVNHTNLAVAANAAGQP